MNSPPPRGEYLLLISNLVVCSTIYSHHYGLLCIYFLLWVLIHYYIICYSNRSTLALVMFAAWLLDPLTCFVILRLSFFFVTTGSSRPLCFLCPGAQALSLLG